MLLLLLWGVSPCELLLLWPSYLRKAILLFLGLISGANSILFVSSINILLTYLQVTLVQYLQVTILQHKSNWAKYLFQVVHHISVLEALKQLKHEGPLVLYRGVFSPLVHKSTTTSIMFGTYSQYSRLITENTPLQNQVHLGSIS